MSDGPNPDNLYNLKVFLTADPDDQRIGSFSSCLDDIALSSAAMREHNRHTGPWIITWLFDHEPQPEDISRRLADAAAQSGIDTSACAAEKLVIEKVPAVNWLAHSYRQFQPFTVGRFFVFGSHYEDAPPADLIPLQIDAATAFGSGEHGTTKGCLLALLDLQARGFEPRHVLDMGAGSGILAVAAAKLWPCPVLGIDIDEEAVRVAAHHAALNRAQKTTAFHAGDGFAAPILKDYPPFDLVIANILAGPLKEMAADLHAATAPGGYALLSGLLDNQADDVLSAYTPLDMTCENRTSHDGWATLVLRKKN